MEWEKLDKIIFEICQAAETYRNEKGLSYDDLVSEWGLGEEAQFAIEAKYLTRLLQRKNEKRFFLRLLVLIRCAECAGVKMDSLVGDEDVLVRDGLQRIKAIIDDLIGNSAE